MLKSVLVLTVFVVGTIYAQGAQALVQSDLSCTCKITCEVDSWNPDAPSPFDVGDYDFLSYDLRETAPTCVEAIQRLIERCERFGDNNDGSTIRMRSCEMREFGPLF